MRSRLVALVSLAALTSPIAAADLSKYKDWDKSPEAYFLTKVEREKWASVTDDSAAEAFINAYKAARGGGFAAAIQSRIEFADKAFKLGKKKGSETLRGKTLVIFGPPTNVATAGATGTPTKVDPTSGELAGAGGGEKGSGGGGNVVSNVGGAGPDTLRAIKATSRVMTTRWNYTGPAVPAALKRTELTLEFTVDPDEVKEAAKEPEKLNEMLDAVVEYWGPKTK